MKQSGGKDCASVGMKLPNGTFIGPITEDHLFWVRPGKSFHAVDSGAPTRQSHIIIDYGQPLSFVCHVIDPAYVRTYVRTRLRIVRVG